MEADEVTDDEDEETESPLIGQIRQLHENAIQFP